MLGPPPPPLAPRALCPPGGSDEPKKRCPWSMVGPPMVDGRAAKRHWIPSRRCRFSVQGHGTAVCHAWAPCPACHVRSFAGAEAAGGFDLQYTAAGWRARAMAARITATAIKPRAMAVPNKQAAQGGVPCPWAGTEIDGQSGRRLLVTAWNG